MFEVTSQDTWKQDLTKRRELHARLKIPEYFVFDSDAKYLDPPLQGFRQENRISMPNTPEPDGRLMSRELGLRLLPEREMLRLFDLRTGLPISAREERIVQETQRADQEKQRTLQAKKRADLLAAELAKVQTLLPPKKPK